MRGKFLARKQEFTDTILNMNNSFATFLLYLTTDSMASEKKEARGTNASHTFQKGGIAPSLTFLKIGDEREKWVVTNALFGVDSRTTTTLAY